MVFTAPQASGGRVYMCSVRTHAIVAALALLSATAHVCADVSPPIALGTDALAGAAYVLAANPTATPATHSERPSNFGDISPAGFATPESLHGYGTEPLVSMPIGSVNASAHGEIRSLPPLPGSASLFLSAMLSIGGWHLLRSARHIHLAALPEWYQTAGPAQVGHAVPCDLDFSALPVCCLEQPAGERPYLYRVRREHTPRCDAQCFLIIAAPRGPPALS